jgi:predicted Holliday junction resolvase-like endonuclease
MIVISLLILLMMGMIILLLYYWFNANTIIQKQVQHQLDEKLSAIRIEITNYERVRADSLLTEWKVENEIEIRHNAIALNSERITNEITSETSIFSENFSFNPRDIKFIGKFIDLIVFDGAAEENQVSIYFLEINRKGTLSSEYKKKVKLAIENKRFKWEEINI